MQLKFIKYVAESKITCRWRKKDISYIDREIWCEIIKFSCMTTEMNCHFLHDIQIFKNIKNII